MNRCSRVPTVYVSRNTAAVLAIIRLVIVGSKVLTAVVMNVIILEYSALLPVCDQHAGFLPI
jgi:hypothetical protein